VIDYQPSQFAAIRSIDPELLTKNIVSTVKVAQLFGLPIVHPTVNVSTGLQQATVQPLAELLSGSPPIDRTTINAWEDPNFVAAGPGDRPTQARHGRALDRDVPRVPTLDARREGFEVYPVTDTVGRTSAEAHRAALERIVQAGAQPVTWVSLAGELQRDWARQATVAGIVEVVLNERLLKE
jgi:nicotinamidase-related amidase